MAKVNKWVWIVGGVVALGILGVVVVALAGLFFVRSHFAMQSTTANAASSDFESVRSRFTGQKPLIELDDHGNFVRANAERPAGKQRPAALNIMVFDSDEEKVVRMDIPFWLLRLKSSFSVGGGAIDLQKMRISVEDLERFGPTLIVDHKDRDGSRVLVWSQ